VPAVLYPEEDSWYSFSVKQFIISLTLSDHCFSIKWAKAMRTLEKKEDKEMKRSRIVKGEENGVKMKRKKGLTRAGQEEQKMKC
jgi:hypothetical protein